MTKSQTQWGKWDLTIWAQMDDAQVVQALGELYSERLGIESATLHAVNRARKLGVSWQTIATELNMSRQAAWERWHHVAPS